jgi:DNA-binding LacI/PurR family transcriptional regulator
MNIRTLQKAEQPSKHLQVRNGLREALSNGEFEAGSFLPGERLLSERFGVSYMTARRAIETLVEEGLCQRSGKRTMVAEDALRLVSSLRLNLLCARVNTFSEPLLKAAEIMARKNGWITQLMIIHGPNDPLCVRAISSGEPCILLLPEDALLKGKIGRALSEPHGPVVLVGNRPFRGSVPWVMANDIAGMQLAIRHLRQLGHRSLLFVHDVGKHQGLTDSLKAWKLDTDEKSPNHNLTPLCVNAKADQARPRVARQAIKDYLAAHQPPSAIICGNDELAMGVLHGLRDHGIDIPGDVSLMSIGDTVLAEYSVPSLSVVDVRFDRHIRIAADLIVKLLNGDEPNKTGHIIQPRLVKRESTAAPKSVAD